MEPDSNIKQFAEIAGRFCEWAEHPSEAGEDDILIARKLFTQLHLGVISLEDVGCGEDTEAAVGQDEWKRVLSKFQDLPINLYYDVFDPLKAESPVTNSLADDVADIYRDVKEGLLLYKNGRIVEAVWEWRFNFRSHWGAHLTSAQQAIHSYLRYQ